MRHFLLFSICLLWTTSTFVQAQAPSRLHAATLDTLIQRAQAEKTSILLLSKQGNMVVDTCFRGKKETLYRIYSITKLFSGLAVGLLYDQGLITSADDRFSKYFPEWAQDSLKKEIRIRHVLQHLSGLYTSKGSIDIYPQPDFVQFALNDSVIHVPGMTFQYNNRAINLISGLVQKRSGLTLEHYLKKHLFDALDIRDYAWPSDPAGHSWGMDGIKMKSTDLLKIGKMMADKGRWNGRQLISEKWLELAFYPPLISFALSSEAYGFCVKTAFFGGNFHIPAGTGAQLQQAGLAASLARRLQNLENEKYRNAAAFKAALEQYFNPADLENISAIAYQQMVSVYQYDSPNRLVMHSGEIGQQLLVLPDYQLAVVRFIDEKYGRKTNSTGNYRYPFGEMALWICRLAVRSASPVSGGH